MCPDTDNHDLRAFDKEEAPRPELTVEEQVRMDQERNLVNVGDTIDLLRKDPTMREIYIGAGWEQRAVEEDRVDIDLSCFLLDKNDMTRVDDDFIFYNQESGCEGAVRHKGDNRTGAGEGDDEIIYIDLNGVPFGVIKIAFVLSVYDDMRDGKTFDLVRDLYIRLVNNEDGHEILRLRIPEERVTRSNVALCFVMVREGARWHLQVPCDTQDSGLGALAQSYGIVIKEILGTANTTTNVK